MDDPNQIYKLKPDIVSVRPSRSSSQPNFKPRESSGTKTQRNNIPSRQPDYRPSTDRESRTNRKTAAYSSYKPNSNDSGPKI